MRKEEIRLSVFSVITAVIVSVVFIKLPNDYGDAKDILLAGLGFSIGIFSAVIANFYIRYSRRKQFIDKFKIEGTYKKISAAGDEEMFGDKNRIAIISKNDGLTFDMVSQYVHGTAMRIAVSKLTFNDDLSGLGNGSYRYETINNSGTYEVFVTYIKNKTLIYVRFQNLIPEPDNTWSYTLEKINGSKDTSTIRIGAS